MMQDATVRNPDVALADDGDWYGKKAAKGTPWLTRAAAWNALNSRSLYPTYDLADDVREFEDRRRRARRLAGYGLFLILLLGGATWAIWAGR